MELREQLYRPAGFGGSIDLDGETELAVNVDWGAYRLEVVGDDGLSATSVRFDGMASSSPG